MSVAKIFKTLEYGPAPESPEAAYAWLDGHKRKFGLFIDNKWVVPGGKKYFDSTAPATGETLAQIAQANKKDVDKAAIAARTAFGSWSALSGHARARHLYGLARHIQKHHRLLAVIESLDNGKPMRESRDIDVPLLARHFYYHAGWAQLMESELSEYQSVGVIGQVIPWNFPLLMLAWKVAPALAMGNTVVLKPAPATNLSALLFAEIAAESGIPAGVINVITGGDDTGAHITNHPDFDKVAFTGSTDVGRIIRRATAGTGKKLSLELGGKSPYIVFDDADFDSAIEGLVDAIWFNQGQVCCAGSRLLVQENIAERFYDKLRKRMLQLRVGHSLDKNIDMSAVVDQRQFETIERWVKIGVDEGAELYQPEIDFPKGGCFYPPTLLTNVQASSTVVQEEIFGPVLVGMTFRTPSEAVALANNTRYGLAATIWTDNINLAIDVAQKVKAGSVWINSTNLFDAAAGFGGYRESGFGREGGKEGLYEYVRPKWQARPRPQLETGNGKQETVSWGAHVPAPPHLPNGTDGTASQPSHKHGLLTPINRTPKLFVGGKQVRPDGNYTRPVHGVKGQMVGQVGEGNRKDIRDAVEAAHTKAGQWASDRWASRSPHNRAQILYYIAENLAARGHEFTHRIEEMTGRSVESSEAEVELAIGRLFTYAAYADKFGGTVQETGLRGVTIAAHDPIGVIAILCPDEFPLLAFISLVAPAIARGNTVVVVPSEKHPLSATDFYQVLETSDVPAGVINIVTGERNHLAKTLAEHEDVDAIWYFGSAEGSKQVEALSAENMKRTWVDYGITREWVSREQGEGEAFLHESVQVKNIWVPAGV